MRRTTLLACTLLLFAGVSCTENLPTTLEDGGAGSAVAAKSDNAAAVIGKKTLAAIGEDYCYVWGSDDQLYADYNVKAIVNVETKTGTEVFTCRMQGVFNDSGEVLYFDGDHLPPGWRDDNDPATYMSGTFFGFTANWWVRVTPSGRAIIQAHVNPNSGDYLSFEDYCRLYPEGSAAPWVCG